MRLQTKIGLAVLPMLIIPIIATGIWTFTSVAESIENVMSRHMVQELVDFIDHRLKNYHSILVRNRLDKIESFVKNYQKETFQEMNQLHLLETGNVIILDVKGEILREISKSPFSQRTLGGLVNDVLKSSPDPLTGHIEQKGEHRMYAGAFFEPWNWVILYTVSHDTVHLAQKKIRNRVLAVSVGCILVGIGLMVVVFRFLFVKPVSRLQNAAQEIASLKDVDEIDVYSNDELGELAKNMQTMASAIRNYKYRQENWQQHLEAEVEKSVLNLNRLNKALLKEIDYRKKTEQELRESEERFEAIFESTTDCIYVWGKDLHCIYVNRAGLEHLERPREAFLGRELDECLKHVPQALDLWKERLREVFKTGQSKHVEDKFEIDGEPIYTESEVSPIRDFKGDLFAVGVIHRNVTERKKMEQQVVETLNLNRKIISSSPVGILVYNAKGDTILANDMAHEIIGASKAQILSQNFYTLESWEKTGLRDMADRVLRTGEDGQIEVQGRSSFGKEILMDCRLLRFTLSGSYHLLVVIDDIYERKKLEEEVQHSLREKEILLKEIHHRVKNNMQVISSILRMQAQGVDDECVLDIFKESQSRINSMSLVHEQLYQSHSLASIDFAAYLKELVSSLQVSFGIDTNRIHVSMDIDNLPMGVDTAIPCGLIVNELLSNIFKYAFPVGEGEIFVSFGLTADGKALLRIQDNGVGIPEEVIPETSQTLGLRLVYNLVMHQLEGDVVLDKKGGTKFEIEFPYQDRSEARRMEA